MEAAMVSLLTTPVMPHRQMQVELLTVQVKQLVEATSTQHNLLLVPIPELRKLAGK